MGVTYYGFPVTFKAPDRNHSDVYRISNRSWEDFYVHTPSVNNFEGRSGTVTMFFALHSNNITQNELMNFEDEINISFSLSGKTGYTYPLFKQKFYIVKGSDPLETQAEIQKRIDDAVDAVPPCEESDWYNVLGYKDNIIKVAPWVIQDIRECKLAHIDYKAIAYSDETRNPELDFHIRDTSATKACIEAWSNGFYVQDIGNGAMYHDDNFA